MTNNHKLQFLKELHSLFSRYSVEGISAYTDGYDNLGSIEIDFTDGTDIILTSLNRYRSEVDVQDIERLIEKLEKEEIK